MFGISPGGSSLGGVGSLGSFSLNGQTSEEPEEPPQQPKPAQPKPASPATEPQIITSVTAEVPEPNTLVNIPYKGEYITGVGSMVNFTVRDENGDPIPNVTVLESVIPASTRQNSEFTTFPDGVITDLVGRGVQTTQMLTIRQAGDVIVPILASPTPPITQYHTMLIFSPSGGAAIATHTRSFTNLDSQGNLRPFANAQGRSVSNFSIFRFTRYSAKDANTDMSEILRTAIWL
jgi:hypothetical protein